MDRPVNRASDRGGDNRFLGERPDERNHDWVDAPSIHRSSNAGTVDGGGSTIASDFENRVDCESVWDVGEVIRIQLLRDLLPSRRPTFRIRMAGANRMEYFSMGLAVRRCRLPGAAGALALLNQTAHKDSVSRKLSDLKEFLDLLAIVSTSLSLRK